MPFASWPSHRAVGRLAWRGAGRRGLRRLQALARQVGVLYPGDAAICQHYAEQFTRLKEAGTPIGANDLWIACHALAEDATLVTRNTREFERVRGLRLEDWAQG